MVQIAKSAFDRIIKAYPIEHASRCWLADLHFVRTIQTNGRNVVSLQCHTCNRRSGFIAKAYLIGVDIATVPTTRNYRSNEPCARCGKTEGVELHHYAPVAMFGWQEAETYPLGFLCPKCHSNWHKRVNEYLTNKANRNGKP